MTAAPDTAGDVAASVTELQELRPKSMTCLHALRSGQQVRAPAAATEREARALPAMAGTRGWLCTTSRSL